MSADLWNRLFSRLERYPDARFTSRDFAGDDAFLRFLCAEGLITLSEESASYRCSECPENCALPVEDGADLGLGEGLVAVCPHGILDQPLQVPPPKPAFIFQEDRFFERLAAFNGMALDLAIQREEENYVGTLQAREKAWPVLRVPFGFHFQTDKVVGLTKQLVGPIILLGGSARLSKEQRAFLEQSGFFYLAVGDYLQPNSFRLDLLPLLDRIDPCYRKSSGAINFVYEDVQIRIAHETGRHVVEINGWVHPGLEQSDLYFAAFLLIAAHRKVKGKGYAEGWMLTRNLEPSNNKNRLLNNLRDHLRKRRHPDFPEEFTSNLIKTNKSLIRLAVLPDNIVIDSSLKNYSPVGTRDSRPKAKRLNPTQQVHSRQLDQASQKAQELVAKTLSL